MSDYEQINLDIDGIETTIMTDRQTDRQTDKDKETCHCQKKSRNRKKPLN